MTVLPEYDDPKAIEEKYLTDLDGLNRFVVDRARAGYGRHESLRSFILLGSWYADSCGNVFRVVSFERRDGQRIDVPAAIPRVCPHEDLAQYGIVGMISDMDGHDVPKAHVLCDECGQGWTIDNASNHLTTSDTEVVHVGGAYTGRSLSDVRADLQKRTDGYWSLQTECAIRNDKYMRLPRTEANEKGWLRRDKDLAYLVEDGDDVLAVVRQYRHKGCWDKRKRRRARLEFVEVFAKAGWDVDLSEIPNRYCPCELCPPWFVATSPWGRILIGWRKRVINIDWSDTMRDLSELFQNEDATKGPHFIHAWGRKKAEEHLVKIREGLQERNAVGPKRKAAALPSS